MTTAFIPPLPIDSSVASRPTVGQVRPAVGQVLHSLNVGGAEVLAARLARRLRERFRFVFLCLDQLGTLGEELLAEGFPVHVLGRRAGNDWRCVKRLAELAAREKLDLLHAHQYTPFFYARAPSLTLGRRPVLFTEHGRFFPDLPSRKRMLFNRLFLRRADRVVAVGESVKRALVANEGIPASRIEVVYNGAELDDFAGDDRVRREVRTELGIAGDDRVALLVARLDYLKDHATALRAAQRVVRQCPSFKLLLVGEGPERSKIEREIAERGLADCVILVGQRADVRRMLAAADVFLLSSISEGIPVTLIEAMGARLPVVSTDVGGVGEVVEHESTGLLAPSGDDASLAQGLLRLLADEALRASFGRRGRARAETMFTETAMHDRYAAMYDAMAAGASLGAARGHV